MIEKIRKPKKSRNVLNYTVYALIFGMIIATFVFMIPGLGGGGGVVSSAAEVGSKSISLRDYNDQLRIVRGQYQKMFNGEIPPYFEGMLKQQVMSSLVRQEVLQQYAQKNGIVISGIEVSDFLKKEIPAFQEDGVFSFSRYSNYLDAVRTTTAKFEQKIEKDLISRRLYKAFNTSVGPTDVERAYNEQAKKVSIKYSYAKLEDSQIKKALRVSKEEVESYLASEKGQERIQKLYNERKANLKSPEQIDLNFMLIKDEKEAQQIRKGLTSQNFSAIAKAKSEDPISKLKGGKLGYIKRGGFSAEIEAVAFGLPVGEISQPFKTSRGQAIVYVSDKKAEAQLSFDEASFDLAQEILSEEGVQAYKKEVSQLLKANDTASLKARLKKADVSWSKVETFKLEEKSLPGLDSSDEEVINKLLDLKEKSLYGYLLPIKGQDFILKKESTTLASEEKGGQIKSQNDSLNRGSKLLDLLYQNERASLGVFENQDLLRR